MKLEKGKIYDLDNLNCIGWTDGDGTGNEGYNVGNYFDSCGRYIGPDEHGIEPIFADYSE